MHILGTEKKIVSDEIALFEYKVHTCVFSDNEFIYFFTTDTMNTQHT